MQQGFVCCNLKNNDKGTCSLVYFVVVAWKTLFRPINKSILLSHIGWACCIEAFLILYALLVVGHDLPDLEVVFHLHMDPSIMIGGVMVIPPH